MYYDLPATRRRNLEAPTGAPYERAFTKTELMERGWTSSMIKRHLGAPNAVVHAGFAKYQYDTRTVYKAEGSAAFQLDLLTLEDVRLLGPRWLNHYTAYIPAMMKAALLAKAEKADDAEAYLAWAENLPPAKGKVAPMVPPPSPYQLSAN